MRGVTINKITIVVPVFNNQGSLLSLFNELERLDSELIQLGFSSELIFVDDGSTDDSLETLRRLALGRSKTKIIKLSRNFGSVNASRVGLSEGSGNVFTIMAADLQDPPHLIPEMIKKWQEGHKFVICERGTRNDPYFSRVLSRFYYKALRTFVMANYPLGGFDMSLMDRQIIPYIVKSSKNTFTPLLAFWLGFKPAVIKYHRPARLHGKSQWSFRKKLSAMLDVFLGFSIRPMRLLLSLGLFASVSSFAYGLVVFISAFNSKNPVPGYASSMVLSSFLFGIVLLLLGMQGEYLARISDEVNQRPSAVIDTIEFYD